MISFISSTGFFLLAGGAKGGLLDVNPGLIFWLFITFLILLLILKKLAWKPLISALETRENSIRDSIEKAENARAEAEKILEENRKNLMLAEQTAQKIISEGREFSNKLKQEILDNANNESKKIIEQAKAEIERKKEEALGELRGTVADLVINATEKLIDEKLDDEKHRKLVNKFIDNLPKN